jgi:Na+-translocating ferredoxin:NAD+ oxidoreductase RnfG subunit
MKKILLMAVITLAAGILGSSVYAETNGQKQESADLAVQEANVSYQNVAKSVNSYAKSALNSKHQSKKHHPKRKAKGK